MSAAHTSITGFTIIPVTDRRARPTGRRVHQHRVRRAIAAYRLDRRERREWNARVAAERAAAPAFVHPRDSFTLRHAGDEFRAL